MIMSRKLSFLCIGVYVIFLISYFYILPQEKLFIFIIWYIISILIFSYFSNKQGFTLLITYILVTAVFYLIKAFFEDWDRIKQLEMIRSHIVIILNIVIIYGYLYIIKELEVSNKDLKQRVSELMHFIGSSKVLTKQEFKDRSNLLITAMKRRKEKGYIINFSFNKGHINNAFFETVTNIAIDTFRNEYDLVGKWDDFTFVVLLQNTNESGMEIAMDRFYEKIKKKIRLKEEDIQIYIRSIGYDERQVDTA